MRYAAFILIASLLNTVPALWAHNNNDALAPKTSAANRMSGPLHTITIATHNLEATKLFYCEGLGLTLTGPMAIAKNEKLRQSERWSIPDHMDWDLYLLHRPGVEPTIRIRLLLLKHQTPSVHHSWSAMERGPFSLGFPNQDQVAMDRHMRRLGFGSLNPLESYEVPRPDGTRYRIDETIFNGPDFVHAVGIHRGGNMMPLGPLDPKTGLGGPSYSAQMVVDSDKTLAFYTQVLDMELRSDREWKSAGTKGALNIPDGTVFRFSIVYAKGARTGHLLFVHYRNREAAPWQKPPQLPNRGLVMWSFSVKDLKETARKAKAQGIEIIQDATTFADPILNSRAVMIVRDPNGMTVELFEAKDAP